jgi:inosine-uridine nucleoside N-ribohydrolase
MNTEHIETGFILDTDPWYDPDDLFALHFLLNSGITPDLIVTGDEVESKRAKLTKWFLEQLGRPEIKVVAGSELPGRTRLFCEDLIAGKDYDVSGDVVEEIKQVVEASDRTVYLGIQALSNLAEFQKAHPELGDRITLYQMGGSVDLKREKADHNVRIDIPAARQVLESGIETYLVLLDTTLNPKFEISNRHPLYTFCKQHQNPGLRAIAQNIDKLYQAIGLWTFMHDPLTVSAALGHDFVDFYEARVAIDEKGMLKRSDDGYKVYLSRPESRDVVFMEHFAQTIMGGK